MDPQFRARLRTSPRAAVEEAFGVRLPPDLDLKTLIAPGAQNGPDEVEKVCDSAFSEQKTRSGGETTEGQTGEHHPLAALAGKYEGEEWEALLEAIRRNRQELVALEATRE